MHCLNDVCPHRGAPLSQGWVTEKKGHDCVVCPYHGWAFDEGGVLRDVPAADRAEAWPEKQLVDTYAVQEKVCYSPCLLLMHEPCALACAGQLYVAWLFVCHEVL